MSSRSFLHRAIKAARGGASLSVIGNKSRLTISSIFIRIVTKFSFVCVHHSLTHSRPEEAESSPSSPSSQRRPLRPPMPSCFKVFIPSSMACALMSSRDAIINALFLANRKYGLMTTGHFLQRHKELAVTLMKPGLKISDIH